MTEFSLTENESFLIRQKYMLMIKVCENNTNDLTLAQNGCA